MSARKVSLVGNPVRIARQSLGKSIGRISVEAGLHYQAWYLTECGCYQRIPPRILKYLSRRTTVNISDYDKFRRETQAQFGEEHLNPYKLPAPTLRKPPLEAFLETNGTANRTYFSKAICVQPSLVYRTLLGDTKELPSQIREALSNAGVTSDDIEELNERTIEYYESWPSRMLKSKS